MAWLTIRFTSRRGWPGAILVLGAGIAVLGPLIGIVLLPGLLCGETLTSVEAERSIRTHLEAQAALRFQRRLESARPGERSSIATAYRTQRQALEALELGSVDVDTVVFGYTRIRRSFVVEVVTLGDDQELSTRYYCFMSTYLTGECSRWHWIFAW